MQKNMLLSLLLCAGAIGVTSSVQPSVGELPALARPALAAVPLVVVRRQQQEVSYCKDCIDCYKACICAYEAVKACCDGTIAN